MGLWGANTMSWITNRYDDADTHLDKMRVGSGGRWKSRTDVRH